MGLIPPFFCGDKRGSVGAGLRLQKPPPVLGKAQLCQVVRAGGQAAELVVQKGLGLGQAEEEEVQEVPQAGMNAAGQPGRLGDSARKTDRAAGISGPWSRKAAAVSRQRIPRAKSSHP